jgi:alpha-N-arabinofuranosidase
VFYHGAQPYTHELRATVLEGTDPKLRLVQDGGQFSLRLTLGPELKQAGTALVTTALLGKAKIPDLAYENAAGSPLRIDTDYLGKQRNIINPTPGPFENPGQGELNLKAR